MHTADRPDESILLVESDKETLAQMEPLLSSNKRKSLVALSFKQAVAKLESDSSIDLVLCSARISGGCAADLVRFVKRTPRFQYIPVIVYGSNCSPQDILSIGRLGVDAVLSIPVDKDQLEKRIAQMIADGKRRVLVIDDEPVIRDILAEMLSLERFKVLTADSAETGLEILDQQRVHIVVSDILLPGKSGLELLTEIKAKDSNMPVILITGYAGRYTTSDAIAAGADGYFVKPFKNIELVRILHQVLAQYETKVLAKAAR
ncbi:MAG: response regulator [Candidatus Zixiibacteriota bacterium]